MDIGSIINAIALGIVQGLTEFIPVSSSGHLYILPQLFGGEAPSTILILFAHFGTLIALIAFFRSDIWNFILAFRSLIDKKPRFKAREQTRLLKTIRAIIVATIPAGVVGYLASSYIDVFYDSGSFLQITQAVTLAAMAALGAVFILSEGWFRNRKRDIDELPVKNAFFVGLSQALAFIRGTSRSGISILTGQAAGLSRTEAARFSFFMSIPLIAATSVLGIYDLTQLPSNEIETVLPQAVAILISSAISGYFAIRFLLNYLQRNNLKAFGWYRIIFAVVAALLLFTA